MWEKIFEKALDEGMDMADTITTGTPINLAVKGVKGIVSAFEEEDEIYEKYASICKKLFDALLESGFDRIEALQIVANAGLIDNITGGK